jgi:hypothetical protein
MFFIEREVQKLCNTESGVGVRHGVKLEHKEKSVKALHREEEV